MANRAGTVAQPSDLVNIDELIAAYFDRVPDAGDPDQRVAFGTSGHRGSSLKTSFNDTHIAAITQAIVEYRAGQGITGPLFMGKDTHALSGPAQDTALEVLAANGVNVLLDSREASRPPLRCPTRSSSTTRPARPSRQTALSSRRPTTRRPTAASSTTLRTAAPQILTRPSGLPRAPTSSWRPGSTA